MFETIYIENEVEEHPQAGRICERFKSVPVVPCTNYGEIFNRKNQNFRLQKAKPSLILAKKYGNLVLPTPPGYGIGSRHNYYFSHMLNCVFDCRYCFLQGMYNSANYVVFVNHEDFEEAIEEKIQHHAGEGITFFSGYDCDSLALENVTHFVEQILPFFEKHRKACLELRTKSTNIRFLLQRKPLPNCVVAFTLTPKDVADNIEHKTPSLQKRIEAIDALQRCGWSIGLRFDPIIYMDGFKEKYHHFFEDVFGIVKTDHLHSVTMGPFRLPRGVYKNMVKLYPEEKLFAHSLEERSGMVSYAPTVDADLIGFCHEEISRYIPKELFFPCEVPV